MPGLPYVAQPWNAAQKGRDAGRLLPRCVGNIGDLFKQFGAQGQEQVGGTARVVQFAAGAVLVLIANAIQLGPM